MDIPDFSSNAHLNLLNRQVLFKITKEKDLIFSRAKVGSGTEPWITRKYFPFNLLFPGFYILHVCARWVAETLLRGSVRLLSGINHMLHDKIF